MVGFLSNELRAKAGLLGAGLNDTYSFMECKKALFSCEMDIEKAAVWLTDGTWMAGKLISWDHESLAKDTSELVAQYPRKQVDEVSKVLKHCGGDVELARRKISGQPLLVYPEIENSITQEPRPVKFRP